MFVYFTKMNKTAFANNMPGFASFSIAKWASEYYTNPSYPDEVAKVTKVAKVAHTDTTVPLFFSYV
jgi:hypothetical protein